MDGMTINHSKWVLTMAHIRETFPSAQCRSFLQICRGRGAGGACWYFRTGNRQGVRYGNFSCKTGWDIYDSWCLSLKSPLWLVNAMKHLWKHGMSAIFHPFSTSPCPSICLTTIFLGILQQLKVYHGPFQTFHLPSGKHTENYVTSSFLMGKSTINGHFQ